ncbi:MAG: hypothetical protein ACOC26_03000 [Halochromatium sp.]
MAKIEFLAIEPGHLDEALAERIDADDFGLKLADADRDTVEFGIGAARIVGEMPGVDVGEDGSEVELSGGRKAMFTKPETGHPGQHGNQRDGEKRDSAGAGLSVTVVEPLHRVSEQCCLSRSQRSRSTLLRVAIESGHRRAVETAR